MYGAAHRAYCSAKRRLLVQEFPRVIEKLRIALHGELEMCQHFPKLNTMYCFIQSNAASVSPELLLMMDLEWPYPRVLTESTGTEKSFEEIADRPR